MQANGLLHHIEAVVLGVEDGCSPGPSGRSPTVRGIGSLTSNGFTLADPNDRGMLDVVDFDTSVPVVVSGCVCG